MVVLLLVEYMKVLLLFLEHLEQVLVERVLVERVLLLFLVLLLKNTQKVFQIVMDNHHYPTYQE